MGFITIFNIFTIEILIIYNNIRGYYGRTYKWQKTKRKNF